VSPYVVRTISAADHLGFIDGRDGVSFLQTPAWGAVKAEWRSESVGWFADGGLAGVALVLYRQLPRLRRYLAYLPEGPVLDWSALDLPAQLDAMAAYLKQQRAFAVRMGPPVVTRRWSAATIKAAIADDGVGRLVDVPPDETDPTGLSLAEQLRARGWTSLATAGGFAAGQPQYVFQLPLAGRTPDDVLAGMNQLWRRNIKKAAKSGVEVSEGKPDDLPAFHALYVETAQRDGFTPRPLGYFQQMFTAMTAEDPDRIRLYLAHHEGDLVAATTWVRVGRHVWYSYGASSTDKREVRGSNAVQWRMVTDAIESGASVYDLRGITDTLAAADPHIGLIQFKVGTGGEAVEYVGEWDLPLNAVLYRAFSAYMRRR
jgi:vancomycin resistance protein VanK